MPSGWVGSGRRARLPSNWPAIRAAVLRRDGHQCTWVQDEQRCTQPAIEVDHSPQHHKPIHITVDVGPDITPSLLRSTHRIPSPTITIDTTKLGTSCQVAGAAPHHNQTATHGNGNKPGIAPSSTGGMHVRWLGRQHTSRSATTRLVPTHRLHMGARRRHLLDLQPTGRRHD
jgi:hypothetical protein